MSKRLAKTCAPAFDLFHPLHNYMPFASRNPATGELLEEIPEITDAELEKKLALAQAAAIRWRATTHAERSILLKNAARYMRAHANELGMLMTQEMGKTISAAKLEIEKCAACCDYYAEHGPDFLRHEPIALGTAESYVAFEPLGVVLAVMPWNFPFWQVVRFAAPALMAGNVGVLKHASNVPRCAQALEKIFIEAGFPPGSFQNLLIGSARVEGVIRDPRVAAITLTGSEKAGVSVARIAGEELKKVVLELGGSDPFIVFGDADIDKACDAAVAARLQNNVGQSCIAAKRFFVHESVRQAFVESVRQKFAQLVIGDPALSETTFGPLASEQSLRDIERQVKESIERGAKVVIGAKRWGNAGYFFEPTILDNIVKGMPVFDEEVFGPVLPIISFENDDEALAMANDTAYGLGATVFTRNPERIKRFIADLAAGTVFVNGAIKSDPRAPFGGIKKSGYGRELSHYGLKEFVNIKTVVIA